MNSYTFLSAAPPRMFSLGKTHPPPPGINCQATQQGGAVCSDGTVFPPN